MLIFLAVLHGLIVIGFTARILLRDDLSPPARLAWFSVVNLVPYLGSAIYFLFGEIDIGHHAATKRKVILAEIEDRGGHLIPSPSDGLSLIDDSYRPAFAYAASINGFQPLPGNSAELLENADHVLKTMIRDIDAAKNHVHVLYYIWLDDHTGTEIAHALIRAAQRGVTCRALADGLGSRQLIGSALWDEMAAAGVQVAVSLPLNNPVVTVLTSRIDLRNHRKITVIDGCITYCGSQNSADPEFRVKPKYAPWVDIMLRFEGPVVAQNQLVFISDWMAATGDRFDDMPKSEPSFGEGFLAQVMADGPTVRRGATPQLFSSLIASAHSSITISTPYFVPDATLLEALCAAAFRGVRVTLIFPAKNDSWVVAAASRSFYRKLLEAGCLIYEFKGGLLHAKTLTLDSNVTLIGSTNLDLRSFDLNYENNILLQDEAVTEAVYGRQIEYRSKSRKVEIQDVRAWSPQRRVWHNVVATVGPIL